MRRVFAALMLGASSVLVAEACGETLTTANDTPVEAGIDAASSDGPLGDAPIADAGGGCNPDAAFTMPIPVKGLPETRSFSLTADEKIAFYVKNAVVYRVDMVEEDEVAGGGGSPITINFDGGAFFDGGPQNASVSADGRVMFLEVDYQPWIARRQADGSYAADLIINRRFGRPFYDEAHKRLFATRYYGDGGAPAEEIALQEVVSAVVGTDERVFAFSPIGLRAPAYTPVVAPNGGALYFSAFNPTTKADIHFTLLPPTVDADVPLASLNSSTGDAPLWISADDCRLYLVSEVTHPDGRVYLSRRGP